MPSSVRCDIGVGYVQLVVSELTHGLGGVHKLFRLTQPPCGYRLVTCTGPSTHCPTFRLISRCSVRRDPSNSMPSCSASFSTDFASDPDTSPSPNSNTRVSFPIHAVAKRWSSASCARRESDSGSQSERRITSTSRSLAAVARPRATEPNRRTTRGVSSQLASKPRNRSISCWRNPASPSIQGAARCSRLNR
jgi:hypothetical protein